MLLRFLPHDMLTGHVVCHVTCHMIRVCCRMTCMWGCSTTTHWNVFTSLRLTLTTFVPSLSTPRSRTSLPVAVSLAMIFVACCSLYCLMHTLRLWRHFLLRVALTTTIHCATLICLSPVSHLPLICLSPASHLPLIYLSPACRRHAYQALGLGEEVDVHAGVWRPRSLRHAGRPQSKGQQPVRLCLPRPIHQGQVCVCDIGLWLSPRLSASCVSSSGRHRVPVWYGVRFSAFCLHLQTCKS